MKVIVNIPCQPTREYSDDFFKNTIPHVGENFDSKYVVESRIIQGDTCTLNVVRSVYYGKQ